MSSSSIKVNSFTLATGGKIAHAHNVLLDVVTPMKQGKAYAAYVAVGRYEDGVFEAYATVPVTVDSYNVDPSKGELFAVYVATLGKSELAAGRVVNAACLTPEPGGTLVNRAQFDGVARAESETLTVRAEIRIAATQNGFALTAGDNALAAVLVGMQPFSFSGFKLARGGNYHPTLPIKRSSALIYDKTAATPVWEGNTLCFRASFTASPYEYLLLWNNVVVARAMRYEGATTARYNLTLRDNSSTELTNVHFRTLGRVVHSGATVTDVYTVPYSERVEADCVRLIDYPLPVGARLIGEPGGRYMLVSTRKELALYRYESAERKIKLVAKLPPADVADVTTDGRVVVGGEKLTVYEFGENSSTRTTLDYGAVTGLSAISDNGALLIACVSGGDFVLLKVIGGEVTVADTLSPAPADLIINKHDRTFIDYASPSSAVYASAGAYFNNANNAARLQAVLESGYDSVELCGRWQCYCDGGAYYLGNFEGTQKVSIRATDVITCVGELALSSGAGYLRRAYRYYGQALSAGTMSISSSKRPPTSAVMMGEYILCVTEDGSTYTLYPLPNGITLFCPGLSGGDGVSFAAVVAKNPLASASAITAVFTFNFE